MSQPDITSVNNPHVKSWVALDKRSEREATGAFLVEGSREAERVASFTSIRETIWCVDFAGPEVPAGAVTVSEHVFRKISRRANPDGVAVIAESPRADLEVFRPPSPALVLVADGVEKPGNIGAIIRTTDALGAAFLGSDLGTDLVNPNVIRSAQGSLFAGPTASVDGAEAVAWCEANTSVVVLRPDAGVTLWDLDLTRPTSIVIGAEHAGVSDRWNGVGVGGTIPMVGSADSLNASVSAAIALAEATRQRSVATSTT